MKINEKIRRIREINNYTQEDMADKLGISTTGYANIERGQSDANTERLTQIANIFGLELFDLMAFGEKNTIVCTVGDNNISHGLSLNIVGKIDERELVNQLSVAQKEILHKQEIIDRQQQEIERQQRELISLHEIITLFKKEAC
ncbi:MAG: transcriptional regulator [Gammaproteobacteria bacterium]|nr:MAG: transcriptional regulator [Gammaproteobacteria bacterium]